MLLGSRPDFLVTLKLLKPGVHQKDTRSPLFRSFKLCGHNLFVLFRTVCSSIFKNVLMLKHCSTNSQNSERLQFGVQWSLIKPWMKLYQRTILIKLTKSQKFWISLRPVREWMLAFLLAVISYDITKLLMTQVTQLLITKNVGQLYFRTRLKTF